MQTGSVDLLQSIRAHFLGIYLTRSMNLNIKLVNSFHGKECSQRVSGIKKKKDLASSQRARSGPCAI